MSIFLQEGSAGKEGTNKQESGLEARFSDLLVTLALGKILVPSAYFFHKAQLPTSLDCENSSEIADMTVYTKKQDTLKLPSSLFPKNNLQFSWDAFLPQVLPDAHHQMRSSLFLTADT